MTLDLTGQRFGRLTALHRAPRDYNKRFACWYCQCDCGNIKIISTDALGRHTKSCGCLRSEVSSATNKGNNYATKHKGSQKSEYDTWSKIKGRCYNKNLMRYNDWGGRGIKVCNRWIDSFENFLEDMGPKPSPYHSIERRDNNGDYSPENCYWGTYEDQNRNKRSTIKLTAFDETKTIFEWSTDVRCVVSISLLRNRYYANWDCELSITTPKMIKGNGTYKRPAK